MPTAFDCRLQERQPTQAGGQSNCADNCVTRQSCVAPAYPPEVFSMTDWPALYEDWNRSRSRSQIKDRIEVDRHWKKWDRNSTRQNTENYYNYWYLQNNFSLSTKSMSVSDLRCSEPL